MGMWTGIIGLRTVMFVPGRLAQKIWSSLGLGPYFIGCKEDWVDSGRIVWVVVYWVGLAASL